ncbi:hypothetical protein BCL57_002828 [Agromyces flavus]|uniref:Integral membrane protein n=1 Tax=Agromyces flavus TaxID=589382 RepID=A0A1H1LX02_9MICO|nr:hypothetical protein [Agromyces flavus]MCP2368652.1 hypothetical protein [Agromyces flavus]GGI48108.1 hypothetical protein GCM10010932_27960 [Agromyces flavus]SDR78772.1 hypothetical protein SAMN04489721_0281 [Agromyces flavus]
MSDPTSSELDLRARIAALEAENATLREATGATDGATAGPATSAAAPRPRRRRGRTIAAVALVIIGLLLAPVAVVSAWARLQLVDTDRFVATFAPLAEDPDVQALISAQVTDAIEERVDIPGLTKDVFDGIRSLDLPPRAEDALGLLEAPAAQGLETLVGNVVDRIVTSDAFEEIWRTALTASHRQFVAAIQGDPDAALAISDSGALSIQLGPIIERVKERLQERGLGFASAIPAIDKSIVIAQADSLVLLQTVYTLAVAVGTWLPFIVLLLLVAGVLVAKRRSAALVWTAGGLALTMLITLAGFGTGRLFFVSTVSPSIMPAATARSIWDQLVELMISSIAALTVLAIAVALIAWLSSPWRPARAVRSFADDGFGAVRSSAEAHGITTGRFGEALHQYRVAIFAAIAVIAALVLIANRPLEVSTVVWTVVLALVAVLLVELLSRPPADSGVPAAVDGDGAADEVVPAGTATAETGATTDEVDDALHRIDTARPAG